MVIFLLTFLFLYGGIHFYAFMRLRSVFHFSAGVEIIIAILFLFLIFAPLLVRIAEGLHLENLARFTAYAGYLWMAFIFLFFCLSIALDLLRVVLGIADPAANVAALKMITLGAAASLSVLLVIYGYIDAQKIRVKNLKVETQQILPENGKLRIVQISDIHVGIIKRGEALETLLDLVREAEPDMLVCTGDLLDGERDSILQDAGRFAAVKTKYGNYAILGNHEYYAGLDRAGEFIRKAGFQLLRDDIVQKAGMTIFGEDDVTGRRAGLTGKSIGFDKELAEERAGFVLLLKHQPYVDENNNFNLQLSGHTHDGQIFPFGLITRLFFDHNYGCFELAKDRILYVSRGAGTWGPPVRVFAPPEITVIDIIGQKAN
jgi:uncharacterized protein